MAIGREFTADGSQESPPKGRGILLTLHQQLL
jgi:hypothetical protein